MRYFWFWEVYYYRFTLKTIKNILILKTSLYIVSGIHHVPVFSFFNEIWLTINIVSRSMFPALFSLDGGGDGSRIFFRFSFFFFSKNSLKTHKPWLCLIRITRAAVVADRLVCYRLCAYRSYFRLLWNNLLITNSDLLWPSYIKGAFPTVSAELSTISTLILADKCVTELGLWSEARRILSRQVMTIEPLSKAHTPNTWNVQTFCKEARFDEVKI